MTIPPGVLRREVEPGMKRNLERQEGGAGVGDHLAEERTFLAWIRTGLALMGFGFVVARFGYFLAERQASRAVTVEQPQSSSLWFGTMFIAVGVVVNLLSIRRHLRGRSRN